MLTLLVCRVTFLMSLFLFPSASSGVLLPPSVVQQPAAPALCLLSGEIQPCHRPALLQNQRTPGQRPRADSAGLHGCGRGEALQLQEARRRRRRRRRRRTFTLNLFVTFLECVH